MNLVILCISFWLNHLNGLPNIVPDQDQAGMPAGFEEVQQLIDRGQWSEAKKVLRSMIEELPAVRDIMVINPLETLLGDCHLEEGEYQQALKYYRTVRSRLSRMKDPPAKLTADILNRLGLYYNEVQEYDQAIAYLDSSLVIRQALFGDQNAETSNCYDNLGISFLNLGDFTKARQYHEQAYRIRSMLEDDYLVAESLNNIGLCLLEEGSTLAAKSYFQRSLRCYAKLDRPQERKIAEVILNLGNAYSDLAYEEESHLDSALILFKNSLESSLGASNKDKLFRATAHNNTANILVRQGKGKTALMYYEQALQLKVSVFGSEHPEVAQTLFNMGVSALEKNDLEGASLLLLKASDALYYDDQDQKLERVSDPWTLLKVRYIQLRVALVRYLQSKDQDRLLKVFQDIPFTDNLIDYLYIRYDGIGSKQNLIATSHLIYETAIQMAFLLYEATHEQQFWHQAYFYSEKSRGLLLLEALQKSKAQRFSGIPAPVLEHIEAIEHQMTHVERQQYLSRDESEQNTLSDSLLTLKRRLDDRIDFIAQNHPNYFRLRYATDPPKVAAVQQILQDSRSILSYFLGEQKLWIFAIRRDDFQAIEVPIQTDEFYRAIEGFINAVRGFPNLRTEQLDLSFEVISANAYQIQRQLIEPVAPLLGQFITIIPDGVLAYLPFEALLLSEAGEPADFKGHHYLVNEFAINYSYSTRLFMEMNTAESNAVKSPYLGVAPEFSSAESDELKPLRFNQEEVQVASKILGGHALVGGDATKINFINSHADHQIIHLATHGKANNEEDKFSFVAFSDPPADDKENALLYVNEIYNLDTKADLVILSACETATGRLYTGEGVASIARGFSYAGAKSLVATRWNVNDRTTRELVGSFLDEIRQGQPKDLALKNAINRFIATSSRHHAHPFYWSSFMAIGNMEAVDLVGSIPSAFPYIIALILLTLLLFYARRRLLLR